MSIAHREKNNELYFKKCELFELMCYEIGERMICKDTQQEICRKCPHKHDTHNLNCYECCPIKRALKKLIHKNKYEIVE